MNIDMQYTIDNLLNVRQQILESLNGKIGKYSVARMDNERIFLLSINGDFIEYDIFIVHKVQAFDLQDAYNECDKFKNDSYTPFPFDELLSGAIGYIDQAIEMTEAHNLKCKRGK